MIKPSALLISIYGLVFRRHASGFMMGTSPHSPHSLQHNVRDIVDCRRHNIMMPLNSSPLDDFLGSIFGKDSEDGNKSEAKVSSSSDDEEGMSLSSFQQELSKRQEVVEGNKDDDDTNTDEESEFDGYDLRDAIYEKWGECFDVDFQRVDSYGFRNVYLNVMPFRLGGRRFRHQTEMDYLCHLQAVVEILVKYNQLDYVLAQLAETTKKPRAGTSPLVAVPLRLDLTEDQIDKILG